MKGYVTKDGYGARAKIFIISCFNLEQDATKWIETTNYLKMIVEIAEENKLKKCMDPARFKIEQVFNHLV